MAEGVGRIEGLDRVAEPLAGVVKRIAPPKSRAKDVLSGTWLGHALHPLLTDIPIGSFTSATVLDLIGGRGSRRAADRLVDLGLLASVATAASGAADWSDTNGDEKRTGVVHAGANVVGVSLYALSAIASPAEPPRGDRVGARRDGGDERRRLPGRVPRLRPRCRREPLVRRGPADGLDGRARRTRARRWRDHARVDADGASVLLHRHHAKVLAIGSRCSHAGGPLDEGDVDGGHGTVTCPWHQSEFRLDTGAVVHGPATVPQVAYDVRVTGGRIEVRALARSRQPGGVGFRSGCSGGMFMDALGCQSLAFITSNTSTMLRTSSS